MILNKDEKIKTSPVYIGYLILKQLRKKDEGKIMVYEVVEKLREDLGIVHYRQLLFSLIFLHESGIIEFAEPYLYLK